jgi:hypothetical protein
VVPPTFPTLTHQRGVQQHASRRLASLPLPHLVENEVGPKSKWHSDNDAHCKQRWCGQDDTESSETAEGPEKGDSDHQAAGLTSIRQQGLHRMRLGVASPDWATWAVFIHTPGCRNGSSTPAVDDSPQQGLLGYERELDAIAIAPVLNGQRCEIVYDC